MLFDDETPIGMTSISIDREDLTGKTALLWGSWLAPEYRGKGLSDLMYQSRINWAKAQPNVEKIIVSHRASNLASKYANQKHGFSKLTKKKKSGPTARPKTKSFTNSDLRFNLLNDICNEFFGCGKSRFGIDVFITVIFAPFESVFDEI